MTETRRDPMDFYSPKVRAEIEAHWAEVRAKLRPPVEEEHAFAAPVTDRIEAHRFNARKHVEAAAREMRAVEALAALEPQP